MDDFLEELPEPLFAEELDFVEPDFAAVLEAGLLAVFPNEADLLALLPSDFAEEAERNNITFIGPKSKAIKIMGSKLAAKEAVKKYDIPMVPGFDEAITDIAKAKTRNTNLIKLFAVYFFLFFFFGVYFLLYIFLSSFDISF